MPAINTPIIVGERLWTDELEANLVRNAVMLRTKVLFRVNVREYLSMVAPYTRRIRQELVRPDTPLNIFAEALQLGLDELERDPTMRTPMPSLYLCAALEIEESGRWVQ